MLNIESNKNNKLRFHYFIIKLETCKFIYKVYRHHSAVIENKQTNTKCWFSFSFSICDWTNIIPYCIHRMFSAYLSLPTQINRRWEYHFPRLWFIISYVSLDISIIVANNFLIANSLCNHRCLMVQIVNYAARN